MSLIAEIHKDLEASALQMIVEYRQRLHSVAVGLCKDPAQAEDLVFRTFERVLAKSDSYKTDTNLFGWMKSILENLYKDDMKRPVVRGTEAIEADELERLAGVDWSTDEQILRNSDSEAIRKALAGLDPKYNQVLLMRYYEGFSLKQIADFLRLPIGTVAWRIHVAHRLLSGKLSVIFGKTKKPLAVLAAALTFVSAATAAVATVPALAPVRDTVASWFAGGEADTSGDADASGTGVPPVQVAERSLLEHGQDARATGEESATGDGSATDSGTGVPPVQVAEGPSGTGVSSVQPETNSVPTTQQNKTRKENKMSIKKIVSAALTAATSTLGLAGTINWTGSVDTDLSKPANWGVSTLSGTDNATINDNNQTFTLEKNTSFSTMKLGTSAKTATFDFSANPTNEVYLGAASGNAFIPSAPNMVLSFKDGIWRGADKNDFCAMVDLNDGTTVFDGTTVTNFFRFAWGAKSPGKQLTELKNGAQVYVDRAENVNTGSNAVLKVSGGSKLIANGVRTAYLGAASNGKGFHKIIVEGEGSLLKVADGLRIGETFMGCSVIVTNRATLSVKGLYFDTHHNNLWMSNATVSLLGGYLHLNGVSNRLDLLDCDDVSIDRLCVCGSYGRCCIRGNQGRITLPTFVNSGGSSWGRENEVEIWDTATAIDYGGYDSPVGRGNVYRLMRSAVVNTGDVGLFVGASQRELDFCGEGTTGGVVRCNKAMTFASAQTNCYLRLMDGVRYENLTTDFYFGYRSKNGLNDKGINSTIYIGTNSTMSLLKLYVGNTGHRVVIDSGTLETPEIKLNADNRVGGTQTNSVVFAGTHPKFLYTPSAAYSLPTAGGWYVFEVPPEGYEAAPLQVSKGLTIPDGAQVVVHADIEKLSRHFGGKGGLVPLMAGTSVTVSDAKLAAMTQALGQPDARFVVKDNVLYLRVSARGMMILLF